MKKNKIEESRNFRLLSIITIIMMIMFGSGFIASVLAANADRAHVEFNEGWDVVINGKEYENVKLDGFKFDTVRCGDKIILTNTLPHTSFISNTLIMQFFYTAFKVDVEDMEIFSYEWDKSGKLSCVGGGYFFVPIEKDMLGKTIRLELNVVENNAFGTFETMRIQETDDAYKSVMSANIHIFILALFMIAIGYIVIIFFMFHIFFEKQIKHHILFCTALFAISMGNWLLCNIGILGMCMSSYCLAEYLEYMSLYVAVISVAHVLKMLVGRRRKFVNVVVMLTRVMEIYIIACIAGTLAGWITFPQTLPAFHVLTVVLLSATVIMTWANKKSITTRIQKIILTGIGLFAGCDLIALVVFYFERVYGSNLLDNMVNMSMSVGALAFIISVIVSFVVDVFGEIEQRTMRRTLEHLAYYDVLTDLYNRNYVESFMKDKAVGKDYTIFCFDLNNLKQQNDMYGHSAGDMLLKSFASILKDVFYGDTKINSDIGHRVIVARIGGDEFMVYVPSTRTKYINGLMADFKRILHESENAQEVKDRISAAVGVAFSYESSDRNIYEVYKLADMRMYEEKEKIKKFVQMS